MKRKFSRSKRAIVGIEAAIVMIAFVVIAAAFAFMVVNMGLFSTQRSQEAIQQGLKEASCPLTIDGSILLKSSNQPNDIEYIIIPLKTLGVKYVPMWTNETVVSVKIGTSTAIANTYAGINHDVDPTGLSFDTIITRTLTVIETITLSSGSGTLSELGSRTIVPGSVTITVGSTQVTDLGNGTLSDGSYTGSIDYDSGTITLTGYTGSATVSYNVIVNSASVTGETDTDDDVSDGISFNLNSYTVVPGSVTIILSNTTVTRTITDSYGNGSLIEDGQVLTSSYIDYDSGTIVIVSSAIGTGSNKVDINGTVTATTSYEYVVDTRAVLVVENDNEDDSLDFFEKGYLIIELDENQRASPRDNVLIEIRPEKSAPLTVSFTVPEAIPANSYVTLE